MVEYSFDRDDYRDTRERARETREVRDVRRDDIERRDLEDNRREQDELIRRLVNDDDLTLSAEEMKIVNDPALKMLEDGQIAKVAKTSSRRRSTGSRFGGAFSQQFSSLRGKLPKVKKVVVSRARKELNKLQSEAFRLANKKLRTKAGQLRKGFTQKDVAKLAQKILKSLRK